MHVYIKHNCKVFSLLHLDPIVILTFGYMGGNMFPAYHLCFLDDRFVFNLLDGPCV